MCDYLYCQLHENQIQTQIVNKILKPITHKEMKIKHQQAVNSVQSAIQLCTTVTC
jgi:hypothetical protein